MYVAQMRSFVTVSEAEGLVTIRKDEILHRVNPACKEQDSRVARMTSSRVQNDEGIASAVVQQSLHL